MSDLRNRLQVANVNKAFSWVWIERGMPYVQYQVSKFYLDAQ